MIGCQRSGSNWMRTMLSGREDLIAPHPPHIMRDFMPILSKYGDLDLNSNLKVSKTQEEAVEEEDPFMQNEEKAPREIGEFILHDTFKDPEDPMEGDVDPKE